MLKSIAKSCTGFCVSAYLFNRLNQNDDTKNKTTRVMEQALEDYRTVRENCEKLACSVMKPLEERRSFLERLFENFESEDVHEFYINQLNDYYMKSNIENVNQENNKRREIEFQENMDMGTILCSQVAMTESFASFDRLRDMLNNRHDLLKRYDNLVNFTISSTHDGSYPSAVIFKTSRAADVHKVFYKFDTFYNHAAVQLNFPYNCLGVVTFNDSDSVACHLQTISEIMKKPLGLVIFSGHGTPDGIQLSENFTLNRSTITQDLFKTITPGKTIFICDACQTGQGFAQVLSNLSGCDVIAPLNFGYATDQWNWCDRHGIVINDSSITLAEQSLRSLALLPYSDFRRFTPGSTTSQPMPCKAGDPCRQIWPFKQHLALQQRMFSSPFGY